MMENPQKKCTECNNETPRLKKNDREAKEILFDKGGISISLIGVEEIVYDDIVDEIVVKFLIVNNSANEIRVQPDDESVNDFMIEGIMSCDVIPGKKAIGRLKFELSELIDIGVSSIDDIETIEFYFNIFERDTYDGLYKSDVVIIRP